MRIDELMIEVTRKCNMQCNHCLRGDAQNKDIKKEHITALLSQVDGINSLTFTGGEPTLNVEAIEFTLAELKRLNIPLGWFYIATNGKKVTEQFVIACLKLYAYSDDKSMCAVHGSNDIYHADFGDVDKSLLGGLSFFGDKVHEDRAQYDPILEGRAKEFWSESDTNRRPSREKLNYDGDTVEGLVYLNCNGHIVAGCDWSYKSQNRHKVCTVANLKNYMEGGVNSAQVDVQEAV